MRARSAHVSIWLALAGCSDDGRTVDAGGPVADAARADSDVGDAESERDAPSGEDAAPPEDAAEPDAETDPPDPGERLGFSVLTYNVAGLPEGISGSNPSVNTELISPKLNAFDLVGVQEDFAYHMQLISAVDHPYITEVDPAAQSLGDGLQLLSRFPVDEIARSAWEQCFGFLDSGSDCLTPKGFLRARITLASELQVDVYDVHMDAGNAAGDLPVRADNFRQLRAAIAEHSAGRAVIVLGDFNERYGAPSGNLQTLLTEASLSDVWAELNTGGILPMPNDVRAPCGMDPNDATCERIDKILVRGSSTFDLVPSGYAVEGARFESDAGTQLSDHRPVSATLAVAPR